MDTSRIESLLEQLLDKQDELIARIETLEATVDGKLAEIYGELNWWGSDPSFAKQLLSELGEIGNGISNIEAAL